MSHPVDLAQRSRSLLIVQSPLHEVQLAVCIHLNSVFGTDRRLAAAGTDTFPA